jgi:hypothetical protein
MADHGAKISWLVFPTCNRPSYLLKNVSSYVSNLKRYDRDCQILIAEDSKTAAESLSSKRIAKVLRDRYGMRVRYSGIAERARYISQLADTCGLPLDVLQFALLPSRYSLTSTGANRNSILLQTAGTGYLTADDDTTCVLGRADHGDSFTSSHSSSHVVALDDLPYTRFFRSRRAAMRSARRVDLDLAAEHESVLFKPVAGRLTNRPMARGPLSGESRYPDALMGDVLVTSTGIAGDSGKYAPPLPISDDFTRECLIKSRRSYKTAMSSREVVSQVPCITLSRSGHFMSYMAGMDNRIILPPFLPLCRNQDVLFAQLLSKCFPNAYFGHLPFTVQHCPASTRRFKTESALDIRFSSIVMELILNQDATAFTIDPAQNLRVVGAHLMAVASTSSHQLSGTIQKALTLKLARLHARYKELLQQFNCEPAYWAAHVRTELTRTERLVASPALLARISDLTVGLCSSEEKLEITRMLIERFGRLLCWWPSIVEAAKVLATREIYLMASDPVGA